VLCDFAERGGVGLAGEEVNHSAHEFVPLLLVVLPQVLPDVVDVLVQSLDPAVDVALLGVCN
jgi:hypothetical protein